MPSLIIPTSNFVYSKYSIDGNVVGNICVRGDTHNNIIKRAHLEKYYNNKTCTFPASRDLKVRKFLIRLLNKFNF